MVLDPGLRFVVTTHAKQEKKKKVNLSMKLQQSGPGIRMGFYGRNIEGLYYTAVLLLHT